MPQPFPNHLVSIPQSILSFKHYFRIHDQGFGRTALYGVILAVLLVALTVAVGLIGFLRDEPKFEAGLTKDIGEALASVSFKGDKATSDHKQAAILWPRPEEKPAVESAPDPQKRPRPRSLLVVLDTTDAKGGLTTWEEAADFAGCAEPRRVVVFGQKAIVSAEPAKSQEQGGGQQVLSYTDEGEQAKASRADLKKLIEGQKLPAGGTAKFPEFTIENGLAKFKFDPDKVHLLVNSAEVMALVDTTGKDLPPAEAWQRVVRDNPRIQPPEFLVLVTSTGLTLRWIYERTPRTLDFAGRGDLSPELLAKWAAATARRTRHDAVMAGVPRNSFQLVMYAALELLVMALICSVAGLLASAFLRAGIPYAQLFTIAVYAMTPARLVLPFLMDLSGVGGQWAMALPFAVGMAYTAMATYRTARELGGTAVAPKL